MKRLRWFLWAGALLLLTLYVVAVFRTHSIRAFSDPYNYLMYARNLVDGFYTSRWPVAYPAYLWVALQVVGPYHVFFANIPLMMAVFGMLGLVTACTVPALNVRSPYGSGMVGLSAVALLLAYDTSLVVHLSTPYRDPFSHAFLLGSVFFLLRFLVASFPKKSLIFCAGLCLGVATSIREPAVLLAFPLSLTAFIAWRTERRFPLFLTAGIAISGALIGLLPMLAQMILATGQAVLPPQAAVQETVFPGFVPNRFPANVGRAYRYITHDHRWPGLLLFVVGAGFAIVRKQREILTLFLPAVFIYTVLYLLYRAFVTRYFLVVTLFAVPVAVYGLWQLIRLLERVKAVRRLRVESLSPLCVWGVVLWACWRLFSLSAPEAPFRAEQARQFTGDVEALVPENAYVVAPRNLCEIVSYFTHADSWRAWAGVGAGYVDDFRIYERYGAMLAAGRPLYLINVETAGDPNIDFILLSRYFDLHHIGHLQGDTYNLGGGEYRFYRVSPWQQTEREWELPRSNEAGAILQMNAGRLWHQQWDRSFARWEIDGRPLDQTVGEGANYVLIDETATTMRLASDAPVSSTLPLKTLPVDGPLHMEFGLFSHPQHDHYLSESIRLRPSHSPHHRILEDQGYIQIPWVWPEQTMVIAKLAVRGWHDGGAPDAIPLVLTADNDLLSRQDIDQGPHHRYIRTVLPAQQPHDAIRLYLQVGAPTGRLALRSLSLYPQPKRHHVQVDIGRRADQHFILSGFSSPERHPHAGPVRWTTEKAEFVFNVAHEKAMDWKMSVWTVAAARPDSAPPENPRVRIQHTTLDPGTETLIDDRVQLRRYDFIIAEEHIQHGGNHVQLITEPWVPSEHLNTTDNRRLGLYLQRVEFSPLPPAVEQ